MTAHMPCPNASPPDAPCTLPNLSKQRNAYFRKLAAYGGLLLLCMLSLWRAFEGAEDLARTGASASVRWVSAQTGMRPITAQQAMDAYQRLQENWRTSVAFSTQKASGNAVSAAQFAAQTDTQSNAQSNSQPVAETQFQAKAPPSLAFWRETQAKIFSTNRSTTATVLTVLGDASLCFPLRMIAGGWPLAGDVSGCILSEQLAWLLWGSTEVTGFPLTVAGQSYTVRGVAHSNQAIFLCAANGNTADGFIGLDVSGLPASDRNTALQTALQSAGLPPAQQVSWPAARAAFARALCCIPLIAAACFLSAEIGLALWRRFPQRHALLLFAFALAVALVLPFLLAQIPAWLIPARWSDSAFWSGLWKTLELETINALSLIAFSQDIPARLALLQTAAGSATALWSVCTLHRLEMVPLTDKRANRKGSN